MKEFKDAENWCLNPVLFSIIFFCLLRVRLLLFFFLFCEGLFILFCFTFWATPGDSQDLFLTLCSDINTGEFRRQYRNLGNQT